MAVVAHSKESRTARRPGVRNAKVSSSSLHGHAVEVSVNERVGDLARRFPALRSSLGSPLQEGRKRIRDFPPSEQGRLLRLVFALKKASSGG